MKPTTQRTFGYPEGECVRASYATLLGVPIDAVPRFDPLYASLVGKTQGELERDFLRRHDFSLVEVHVDPPETIPDDVLGALPRVPLFLSGISPRGTMHRCVGVGGRLVWDPHPSRAGLLTIQSIGMIVPSRAP